MPHQVIHCMRPFYQVTKDTELHLSALRNMFLIRQNGCQIYIDSEELSNRSLLVPNIDRTSRLLDCMHIVYHVHYGILHREYTIHLYVQIIQNCTHQIGVYEPYKLLYNFTKCKCIAMTKYCPRT